MLLGLILVAAFALRFWSIGWGMPYALHSDEPKYLPRAVTMLLRGDLNPHYFENPPFLTYTLLAELVAYLGIGQVLGFFHGAADVGTQLLVAPTPLYVIARMNSVLLGTGTVLLTYLVARDLLGRGIGLAAALLLGVSFLHVRDSHYAVNDVPATFLVMVAAWFATRVYREGRTKDYLLGGAALGLAVATKYNVGLGAVLLVAAHLLRMSKGTHHRDTEGTETYRGFSVSSVFLWLWSGTLGRPEPKRVGIREHVRVVAAGAAALVAFLAANPCAVLDSGAFLKGLVSQYGWTADPFRTSDVSIASQIARALWTGIGPVALAASVLGLIWAALRKPREAALLASFPLAYLAFFLTQSSLFYARFAIPLLPLAAVFAAAGVGAAVRAARGGVGAAPAVGLAAVLLAAAVLPQAALDVRHGSLLRTEDTRVQLGRWIDENVPPGSKLAVEGYTFIDSEGRHVGSRGIEYSIAILPSLRANPLEYYVQEGFDYLISSSYVYGRYQANPGGHAEAVEYYRRLADRFPLAASFSPRDDGRELAFLMDEEITPLYSVFERDRPGPTIKVYRLGRTPEELYRVTWTDVRGPTRASPGQRLDYAVTVRNSGPYPWPCEGFTPVRVGYRWLDEAGRPVPAPEEHGPLPSDLADGEEVTVHVEAVAPRAPGVYTLRLDMVQENFAWLSSKGAETLDLRVEVAGP